MKNALLLITLATAVTQVCGQEILGREETKRYADITHRDLKLLEKAPLKINANLDKAVAAREGEHGGMVIPDTGFTAETLAKIDKDVLPVAEIWLLKLGPICDGKLVAEEKLNVVTITNRDNSAKLPYCVAGIRKTEDKLELVVYGKGKDPIVTLPLKSIDTKQESPIEVEAETTGDGGKVTLKLAGKYKATLDVTELLID